MRTERDEGLFWVRNFAEHVEGLPLLSTLGPEALARHAGQVARLQDLLSCIATLPGTGRPDISAWDNVLGPLWRKLYAKGDDIDRYVLAELWRQALREADDPDRYGRTCLAVAASARNFYLFDEALDVCADARRCAGRRPSAVMAHLINTEGLTFFCKGDLERAETCFKEAGDLARSLREEECEAWIGISRSDFHAQKVFNLQQVCLARAGDPAQGGPGRWAGEFRKLRASLQRENLSAGFVRNTWIMDAELAILEERYAAAESSLERLEEGPGDEGPMAQPLAAVKDRLLAKLEAKRGRWEAAYAFVRSALKASKVGGPPGEEQEALNQALEVVRSLHGSKESLPGAAQLVADLVQLLEDKDWYTGASHSRNVSALAAQVCAALAGEAAQGLDPELVAMSGLLHDIGKLRLPWSLLNKIAPLTVREWSLLKTHPSRGRDILCEMGMPRVARIVAQHHEAFDGSGYPDGLTPSLPAAVLAVCDVFEAMVTPNRRYKTPKSRKAALEELADLSGPRYSPVVVEALRRVVERASA